MVLLHQIIIDNNYNHHENFIIVKLWYICLFLWWYILLMKSKIKNDKFRFLMDRFNGTILSFYKICKMRKKKKKKKDIHCKICCMMYLLLWATFFRDKCWLPNVTLTSYIQRELHPKAPVPIPHRYNETTIR